MSPGRRRPTARAALVAAVLAGLASPPPARAQGEAPPMRTRMRLQMGSLTEITVPAGQYGTRVVSRAFDAIDRLDRLLSTYKPDSEVSRLNREGALAVSPETLEITRRALALAERTGGAFNPALGPLVQLWREAERRGRPPAPEALERARQRADFRRIRLEAERGRIVFGEPGMGLNFGAIGKGYALDRAAEVLADAGIDTAVLASGGSSHRLLGRPGTAQCWELGVRRPGQRSRLVGRLRLGPGGVATSSQSGRLRQIGGRTYGHILDPRTGYPAEPREPVWSATVLAPDAATADALATALVVMEPAAGLALIDEEPGVEALLVLRPAGERGSLRLRASAGLERAGRAAGLPVYRSAGGAGCRQSRALGGPPSAAMARGAAA